MNRFDNVKNFVCWKYGNVYKQCKRNPEIRSCKYII